MSLRLTQIGWLQGCKSEIERYPLQSLLQCYIKCFAFNWLNWICHRSTFIVHRSSAKAKNVERWKTLDCGQYWRKALENDKSASHVIYTNPTSRSHSTISSQLLISQFSFRQSAVQWTIEACAADDYFSLKCKIHYIQFGSCLASSVWVWVCFCGKIWMFMISSKQPFIVVVCRCVKCIDAINTLRIPSNWIIISNNFILNPKVSAAMKNL